MQLKQEQNTRVVEKNYIECWNSQRVKNTLHPTPMNKGVSYFLTFWILE